MAEFRNISADQRFTRRFQEFQNLMRHRVNEILLVSSVYDSFILEEEGRLQEMLLSEYIELNLSHAPTLTRVSTGQEAIDAAMSTTQFDLIITTMNLGDMDAFELSKQLRTSGLNVPIVLLAYDKREVYALDESERWAFEKVFIWQGDFTILIAIVKCIEDAMNLDDDTTQAGVQNIILVEDNVNFYSSYLPLIYTEVLRHHQSLISESVNLAHRLLRMRARPKIILCHSYEEAWEYFDKYHHTVLGVISDIAFPRNGKTDRRAGIRLAKKIKDSQFDIPILLQSNSTGFEKVAFEIGCSFAQKSSPTLLNEVRAFIQRYFSFGDFVFLMPNGKEVGRASDLRELEEMIARIPDESLIYHSERNHFSNWLKARTEFWLAHSLRPQKVSDYRSIDELRKDLIHKLQEFRRDQRLGITSDFDARTFDPESSFARIGGGSLGGKARGLAFVNTLLNKYRIRNRFHNVEIAVPPSVVLGTDAFDQFLDQNNLRDFALRTDNDRAIEESFCATPLPENIVVPLREYLELVKYPIAVRSSSLLEDSRYQPFAGIYRTYMLPNNHEDIEVRLDELTSAIKRVYASTFSHHTKGYIQATSYRLEEEKMAVCIQKMVGTLHSSHFYPDFAGVGRSHNFYPTPPATSADGIVSVCLGLGKAVVEGGRVIRFSPKYPRHLVQFYDTESTLAYSQRDFYALEMPKATSRLDHTRELSLTKFDLHVAEDDGTLHSVGSTYSPENDTIYDGLSRTGPRVVTFAPILKHNVFPLADVMEMILDLGRWGMNSDVEIEFAVNLKSSPRERREFGFLQIRPLVTNREVCELDVENVSPERLFCQSDQVLGNGVLDDIRDIVAVDLDTFDRGQSPQAAAEIGQINKVLLSKNCPYILIGVGRMGSADPWLGIPVSWDQIAGARVIIESGFKDFKVVPSQGTHFFQNITSFQVGYFTVNTDIDEGILDWDWLKSLRKRSKGEFVHHYRLKKPLTVRMNGQKHQGIIIKPEE